MRVALGVAVSLVALAAGCGGDDAATPTTIETPTTTGTETHPDVVLADLEVTP